MGERDRGGESHPEGQRGRHGNQEMGAHVALEEDGREACEGGERGEQDGPEAQAARLKETTDEESKDDPDRVEKVVPQSIIIPITQY